MHNNKPPESTTLARWLKAMELGRKLGCHQMAERSFFYGGYQFPLCARCTGVIFGSFTALILFFSAPISLFWSLVLSGVMFLDWLLQHLNIRHSTNPRRLVTGILGGLGWGTIHLYFCQNVLSFLGFSL